MAKSSKHKNCNTYEMGRGARVITVVLLVSLAVQLFIAVR